MDFRPITFSETALQAYGRLFAACFAPAEKFSPAALDWLYRLNPSGNAVGFDAWEADQLAGHYVCVPAAVIFEGKRQRMLLSLNTATHPEFQGKGLFTKLAAMTYDYAAAQGFDAVFGVANANSTPGFVRKLGFDLVEPLEAKIGLGPMKLAHEAIRERAQFRQDWDTKSLQWRCANPANRVFRQQSAGFDQYFAAAKGMLLPIYSEQPADLTASLEDIAKPLLSPLRLFLGLNAGQDQSRMNYVQIPQRFRPSPLNFIFKPLARQTDRLQPHQVSFSFLDFDAY